LNRFNTHVALVSGSGSITLKIRGGRGCPSAKMIRIDALDEQDPLQLPHAPNCARRRIP